MRNITFFQLGYFYNMCGSKKWVDTGARRRGSPICCEVMIMMIMMMMMMVMISLLSGVTSTPGRGPPPS